MARIKRNYKLCIEYSNDKTEHSINITAITGNETISEYHGESLAQGLRRVIVDVQDNEQVDN